MYCGIDWSERHHDIAVVDEHGRLVAKGRIGDDTDGFTTLVEMLAATGDGAAEPVPMAIETPRGLPVAALRASGRRVYSINPMAVARYRQRHSVSGKKSDHADAVVLAIASTSAAAATLSTTRIAAALRRGGRRRGVEDLAAELQQALRRPQLRQPAVVEEAMGIQALAPLATLNVECASVEQLAEAASEAFRQHPDHAIAPRRRKPRPPHPGREARRE